MMLKQMRKSMAGSAPLFGSSYEAKYYQEMVDDKVAQQMSSTGSFGFAKSLYNSMEHSLGLDKRESKTVTTEQESVTPIGSDLTGKE